MFRMGIQPPTEKPPPARDAALLFWHEEPPHLVRPGLALHAKLGGLVEVTTGGAGAGRHSDRPGVVPPDAAVRTGGAQGRPVLVSATPEGVVEAWVALALGDGLCPLLGWYVDRVCASGEWDGVVGLVLVGVRMNNDPSGKIGSSEPQENLTSATGNKSASNLFRAELWSEGRMAELFFHGTPWSKVSTTIAGWWCYCGNSCRVFGETHGAHAPRVSGARHARTRGK